MSNLLITPQEVVNSAFSYREKITAQAIRSARIDVAQECFIRPRFGQCMFDAMTAGEHPEFTDQYIKPALAHFVRYALVEELSVQVGDQGALRYSSSKSEARHSQGQIVTDTSRSKTDDEIRGSADKMATKTGSSTDVSREEETWLVERISQTEFSFIDNKRATIMGEVSKESNDTQTDSSSHTARTVVSVEKTGTKNDDTTDEKMDVGESMRPATPIEVRTLMTRALSDGNVLLAKAVRYVESHVDDFPNYKPSRVSNRIFV